MRWTQQEYEAYLERLSKRVNELGKTRLNGVASDPVGERSAGNESVAEAPDESPHPRKCVVRVTSYRIRLADERNLHEKAFVDALQTAGAIVDDSPKWCKVQVEQIQVNKPWEQCTVIEITYP